MGEMEPENRPASPIIYQYFQVMDIEEFIKLEENNFSDAELPPQHFPHDFYDQDSELEEEKPNIPIDEVLQQAAELEGFIDMPVQEIVMAMVENYNLDPSQIPHFRKRLRKTKNILKRNRAKGRRNHTELLLVPERKTLVCEESSGEKDTQEFEKEIKKQRNRISAQISRDRKKNYVSTLEKTNKQLAYEAEQLKRQNEELRKAMEDKNQKKKPNNNKFIKLLVLLGIIFFLYIVQDIFHIRLGKDKAVAEEHEGLGVGVAKVQQQGVPVTDSQQVVSELKSEVNLVLDEEAEGWSLGFGAGLKELVARKVGELQPKIQQFSIPRHLLSSMMQAKACI